MKREKKMKCFNKQRYTEMISHVEILLIIIQKKKNYILPKWNSRVKT